MPPRLLTLLGTLVILAAGCTSQVARSADQPAVSPNTSTEAAASSSSTAQPTPTALMVCGPDIKSKVRQILQLTAPPATTDRFTAPVYTCTYHLTVGTLVLSVQHASDSADAGRYVASVRGQLHDSSPIAGLASASYGSPSGVVLTTKDNETLVVDARGVPAVFGAQHQQRYDFAYEVASDVLGCWTGDD
jgi:hypothetical protein